MFEKVTFEDGLAGTDANYVGASGKIGCSSEGSVKEAREMGGVGLSWGKKRVGFGQTSGYQVCVKVSMVDGGQAVMKRIESLRPELVGRRTG